MVNTVFMIRIQRERLISGSNPVPIFAFKVLCKAGAQQVAAGDLANAVRGSGFRFVEIKRKMVQVLHSRPSA